MVELCIIYEQIMNFRLKFSYYSVFWILLQLIYNILCSIYYQNCFWSDVVDFVHLFTFIRILSVVMHRFFLQYWIPLFQGVMVRNGYNCSCKQFFTTLCKISNHFYAKKIGSIHSSIGFYFGFEIWNSVSGHTRAMRALP